uniref:Uncharacterized protein LOC104219099 n=1 Tax=Nicotiana sylvestris TaxID=4096 RepID=A0A1U7W1A7_NICSY|nr:PREDICTED: uncharacterized protein LOC104219099 [Nicotiana sylvestris]
MLLREFVPQSLRDAWCVEFKQLRQGTMSVSEYAIRFSDLSIHSPSLVSTIRERVRRFIEGFHPSLRTSIAQELEIDISYQQTMSIARRVEGMLARKERRERSGKARRERTGRVMRERGDKIRRESLRRRGGPVD